MLFCSSYCQSLNYSSVIIPDKLKENANAVVRNNILEVTLLNIDEMIVRKKRVITILNKQGNSFKSLYAHYDDDTKITKLSAIIYNAFGKQIKKYSKSKFLDVSAVDGGTLYSDSRVKYIDYTPITYPYTVVYECEYKTSSTGFIPSWYPVTGYGLSLEKSSYILNNPKKIAIRKKEKNFKKYSIENNSSTFDYKYSLQNKPAVKYENLTLSFRNFMPYLMVSANDFTLKGVHGKASNWKEFGKWMYDSLLKDRNIVDNTTKIKILKLVEDVNDPIEKAKIVYKYMQDKTRYISVQVGIGGWQPITAKEVDEMGYGDCKGLTNYTKSLLDIVGVKSNYTVVYAKEKRNIDKEFSSIQGNHVILNIPNKEDDIWLECTSKTMPFGFLGDFTDDRDVLVVTPEGGVIKHTPVYKNEHNLKVTKANIKFSEKGNLAASLQITSTGTQYDRNFHKSDFNKKELSKNYKEKKWGYNNNLEIVSANVINNKELVELTEELEVTVANYAIVNEKEYLFRVNVFNRNVYVPRKYRTRNLPFKIERGYKDIDEYIIEIPASYQLINLPIDKNIQTKFGVYKLNIEKVSETKIKYKKTFLLKQGVYNKEDYKVYRDFRKKTSKLENLRIAITKK